jgi:hypothetical protein
MEYALIIATLAAGGGWLYALNRARAYRDALDSSNRQAAALEARRAKDPSRGTNGRFVKKG